MPTPTVQYYTPEEDRQLQELMEMLAKRRLAKLEANKNKENSEFSNDTDSCEVFINDW
jgi:hypothetical protein